jgi:hypothetical protein
MPQEMPMLPNVSEHPHCANCGVEIPWRPAIYRGKTYCCGGCAQGGPCYCSYDLGELDPRRAHRRESMTSHASVVDFAREAR